MEKTENQTQTLNTGGLPNSDSLKENPKCDRCRAISDDNIHFLEEGTKVINDPIHGLMELHPLLIKIMDTPQFQRLRHIKQLGGAYFVYPGASHNRFEHSVGVAHLAGELARALGSKQPKLGINKRDILCVQIAGLCHDLGHGPFSHLYDRIFIPEVNKKKKKNKKEMDQKHTPWMHEDASLRMFNHLVEDNDLKPLMEQYGLKPEENDLVFIKEMIQGKPLTEAQDKTSWPYQGRTEKKSFLYEIVANKENGIDVDKFDYFARDAYHLGMQSNFDHKRFIMLAKVCEVEEKPNETKKHICSRDKEVGNLYDMFHTRNYLHRRAYQHKTTKIIEIMISDAFLKADEHIMIELSGGKTFTLSTAKGDMEAYTKLTDQVFERILHPWSSSSSELEKASNILHHLLPSSELKEAVKILNPKLSPSELEKIDNILRPLLSSSSELEKVVKFLHRLLSSSEQEETVKILHRLLSSSSEQEETVKITDRLSELEEDVKIVHRFLSSSSELKEAVKTLHRLFELEEARKILERIVSRNLYMFVGKIKPKQGQEATTEILQQNIKNLKAKLAEKCPGENEADNFEVSTVTLDYGMKEKDPINDAYFYSKHDPNRGFKITAERRSKLLPAHFSEKIMLVYCKNPKNVNFDAARKALKEWCSNDTFVVLEDEEIAVPPVPIPNK